MVGALGQAAQAEAGALVAALLLLAVLQMLESPPLKAVAYQPEPLSWKSAAVTCLLNVCSWQAGHWVKGASLIFGKTSWVWPQDEQQ